MLNSASALLELFCDPQQFRSCIEYTSRKTGFSSVLIEKDYLCSVILMRLYHNLDTPLIFKGGTLLAKVHSGFYRLSEDLDFCLSVPSASREAIGDLPLVKGRGL